GARHEPPEPGGALLGLALGQALGADLRLRRQHLLLEVVQVLRVGRVADRLAEHAASEDVGAPGGDAVDRVAIRLERSRRPRLREAERRAEMVRAGDTRAHVRNLAVLRAEAEKD